MAEVVVLAAVMCAAFGTASVGLYGAAQAAETWYRHRRQRTDVDLMYTTFKVPAGKTAHNSANAEPQAGAEGGEGGAETAAHKKGRWRVSKLRERMRKVKLHPSSRKRDAMAGVAVMEDGRMTVDGSIAHQDDVCPICLDHVQEGDTMAMLACKHCMHAQCVLPWIQVHESCPLCKCNLREQVHKDRGSASSRRRRGRSHRRTHSHPIPSTYTGADAAAAGTWGSSGGVEVVNEWQASEHATEVEPWSPGPVAAAAEAEAAAAEAESVEESRGERAHTLGQSIHVGRESHELLMEALGAPQGVAVVAPVC